MVLYKQTKQKGIVGTHNVEITEWEAAVPADWKDEFEEVSIDGMQYIRMDRADEHYSHGDEVS